MPEKYGFVYIWYDRKHKRYYIGCHWGTGYDGYICSSWWMKRAYKKRPEDFKRRILRNGITDRNLMLEEEHKWLSQMKTEELRKRYYNIHKHKFNHWTADNDKSKSTKERMIANQRKAYDAMTPEEKKEKFGKGRRGKVSEKKGKSFEEIYGEKALGIKKQISTKLTGTKLSDETKAKLKGRTPNKGKKFSEESRRKMSEAAKKRKSRNPLSDEAKRRIGEKNRLNMLSKWKNEDYRQMQIEAHTK